MIRACWRNGSASASRCVITAHKQAEGWVFDPLTGHCFCFAVLTFVCVGCNALGPACSVVAQLQAGQACGVCSRHCWTAVLTSHHATMAIASVASSARDEGLRTRQPAAPRAEPASRLCQMQQQRQASLAVVASSDLKRRCSADAPPRAEEPAALPPPPLQVRRRWRRASAVTAAYQWIRGRSSGRHQPPTMTTQQPLKITHRIIVRLL